MIEVRGLHYEHPGPIPALRGVDLDLAPGEWVALMGANGSGKTTLVRCLNGLLLPAAGRVAVDGLSTADPGAVHEIRRRVGMVFQSPDDQLVAPTVEGEIAFGLENHGVSPTRMRARVSETLTRFHLDPYRLHPPHLLSGGEKQRLAVASAVALLPRYLVLDEPTALLDPRARRELLELMGQLCHAHGLAILHVTQSAEEAARSQRVLVLQEGRLVRDAPPRLAFARGTDLSGLGLEVPVAVTIAEAAGGSAADALDLDELDAWLAAGFRPPAATAGDAAGADPDSGPARLEARAVDCVYRAGVPQPVAALHAVDLAVGVGRLAGLVGPGGSGKTTLAQHLNGLLRPTRGRVLLNGADIWRGGEATAARRQVGLVFQFPEAQLFAETVAADVAFGPLNHGLDAAARRAAAALESVGLPVSEFGARSPLSLSGGERRRAAIAGVLAFSPAALVLDEPTAGLDAHNRGVVAGLLLDLCRQGRSVVLISHDMDLVAQLADSLTVLDGGRVRWSGPTRAVFDRALRAAGETAVEPPAALRLCHLLRRRGWCAPTLLTVAEACRFVAGLVPRAGVAAQTSPSRPSRPGERG